MFNNISISSIKYMKVSIIINSVNVCRVPATRKYRILNRWNQNSPENLIFNHILVQKSKCVIFSVCHSKTEVLICEVHRSRIKSSCVHIANSIIEVISWTLAVYSAILHAFNLCSKIIKNTNYTINCKVQLRLVILYRHGL